MVRRSSSPKGHRITVPPLLARTAFNKSRGSSAQRMDEPQIREQSTGSNTAVLLLRGNLQPE
jgi:hypothetical protein